ncbi:exocyst complex component 8 [Harmonia axyridis]|uniref:exocyst complex component 8 n=1 Tax=Harmonia axyridis TaxID=115357 RepID=UPI001E275D2F|nr:exocyst complex component 8 [Harmonia axyridis]
MESVREPDINLLSSTDFSPEKYVRDLSQHCVGGPELRRLRKKVQSLSEETNSTLKRNVYQNYMQFIESAKEISHLESEMYQLSHLLSEQKSLLTSLCSTSILGDDSMLIRRSENNDDEDKKQEEFNREKIASILEKVEGCKEILEIPDRTYLYEGPLVELDPLDNSPVKNVQAYLFSDGLMISTRNSQGLMKYVFEVMYEIGSLAVVNVKDLGNVKHAFKLLIFPDTRVFKCSSSAVKKEWLEKIDQAKKSKLNHDQQKRESTIEKSPSRSASIDSPSINPFEEYEEDGEISHPEWFLEAPEELDVCVAQRHFEDALSLLQRALEYAANAPQDHLLTEVQKKVDQRHTHLTEVLMKELEIKPGKSMQGGLGASRRAVRLLITLGQPNQACDLFLNICTCMLKIQCKRVKREGSTSMYIKHLSSVIFTNICHMTEEFLRNFLQSTTCYSAYVVWVSTQLSQFVAHFIKQVFGAQSSLTIVAECVDLVRCQCERLCSYGVDMCYQIDGLLRGSITRTLRDTRDKYVDSIKIRAAEDSWSPTNLKSKNGLLKFLQEYSDLGLKLDTFVTGDIWLQLTSNNLIFTKNFLNLLRDCMKLKTTKLLYTINETLYAVFDAQIRHHELTLREEKRLEQRKLVTKNAEYLLTSLLDVCQEEYKEAVGFPCETLLQIQKEYSALLNGISPTSRSTKTKYSSEFI